MIVCYESRTGTRSRCRLPDRMSDANGRTHSQQLRDVSEAEIARDWQANQDVLAADRPDNAADRSVEAFVKAHTAVLTRASKFLENLQQTSEQLSKGDAVYLRRDVG